MNDTGTMQLPAQASTYAPQVDQLYYFIFWGCLIFFVLIICLSAWFIFRYRRRPGDTYLPSPSHNNTLEITWTIIPLILLMVVFVWGFNGFMEAQTIPKGAQDYYVTGAQWQWQVTHPHGKTVFNEMHVPIDTKVRVVLNSKDVIHSFFVPEFRVKMDAYPNQYTTLWFEATKAGEYDLYCTEYCGREHSLMVAKVFVHTQEDYDAWVKESDGKQEGETDAQYGERLYTKLACVTCHTLDGSDLTGPSFQELWGKTEQLADGSTVTVDENYIRRSLLEPNAEIVAGYDPVMPTYAGLLSDEQIQALFAFIRTVE